MRWQYRPTIGAELRLSILGLDEGLIVSIPFTTVESNGIRSRNELSNPVRSITVTFGPR